MSEAARPGERQNTQGLGEAEPLCVVVWRESKAIGPTPPSGSARSKPFRGSGVWLADCRRLAPMTPPGPGWGRVVRTVDAGPRRLFDSLPRRRDRVYSARFLADRLTAGQRVLAPLI